jgi:tRNA A37 threonylcarbamoyltransferase TsaD
MNDFITKTKNTTSKKLETQQKLHDPDKGIQPKNQALEHKQKYKTASRTWRISNPIPQFSQRTIS